MSKQMRNFGNVAVLMGGDSAEREISLQSGNAVLSALKRQDVAAEAFDPKHQPLRDLAKYDAAFISLHGKHGEDGCIQGALELMKIPYTGSGVMASALAMDKWRTKCLWEANGIPTPAFAVLKAESNWAAVEEKLGLPMFVKPANEGSSIGISKVKKTGELQTAFVLAKKSDDLVLAEQAIEAGEYTVGVIANGTEGYQALPIVRIDVQGEFYDFDAKYIRNDTEYHCPAGLSEAVETQIKAEALKAFAVTGCRGWGRVDFLMDENGKHYFLEVNTSPGMTDHSLVPMAAKAQGIDFDALVVTILEGAHVG